LSADPYAMSLMTGATVTGTLSTPLLSLTNTGNGNAMKGQSTSGIGVWGVSDSNPGVYASSTSGIGLYSLSALNDAVYATTAGGSAVAGVHGYSIGRNRKGLSGEGKKGKEAHGRRGQSKHGFSVYGRK